MRKKSPILTKVSKIYHLGIIYVCATFNFISLLLKHLNMDLSGGQTDGLTDIHTLQPSITAGRKIVTKCYQENVCTWELLVYCICDI